jgi:hypothetical protein
MDDGRKNPTLPFVASCAAIAFGFIPAGIMVLDGVRHGWTFLLVGCIGLGSAALAYLWGVTDYSATYYRGWWAAAPNSRFWFTRYEQQRGMRLKLVNEYERRGKRICQLSNELAVAKRKLKETANES